MSRRNINLLWLCIIWCFGGLLYLLLDGFFDWRSFEIAYWIWEDIAFIVLAGTITSLIPVDYRWIIKPFLYYSTLRFVWEIIALATGMDVNHPKAVILASLVMITGSFILLLRDLKNRMKK